MTTDPTAPQSQSQEVNCVSDEALTPEQLETATVRLEMLEQEAALTTSGLTASQAAERLGVPVSTMHRWRKAWELKPSLSSLAPQYKNCGRKPMARLTPEQQIQVQRLVMLMSKNMGHKVTTATALRTWALTEQCPENLREVILADRARKSTITPTLKRQARVTSDVLMKFRGEKTLKLQGFSQPRSLTWIDSNGTERPIAALDFITWDDAHWNTPFYVECDDPFDPCAAKFGLRAFRAQNLLSVDVGTGRALTSSIVARYSDAYNLRDILWTFKRFLCSHGKPEAFYLEHGAWAAEAIARSMRQLGIKVYHAQTAKGKSVVEKWFDLLQTQMGCVGVPLGRQRGEFDWSNKDWLAVRAGRLDPRKAGYIPVELFHEKAAAATNLINSEKMEGELYRWVPDEKWSQEIRQRVVKPMTLADTYVIAPEQREGTLRNGHVRCPITDWNAVFYFHAEWFADLGTGYKVYVHFDPADPEAGAAILNREAGVRAHRKGLTGDAPEDRPYRDGELIGIAGNVERVPMFSAQDGYDDTESFKRRDRYLKHVRLMFRQIMPFGRGIGARADERRDGRGRVDRTELTIAEDSIQRRPATPVIEIPKTPAPRRPRAMSYSELWSLGQAETEQSQPTPERRQRRALTPEELVNYDPEKV